MPNAQSFNITIKVNGQEIAMNPFVQEIVKNVTIALVSSLKIPDKPQTIEITLSAA